MKLNIEQILYDTVKQAVVEGFTYIGEQVKEGNKQMDDSAVTTHIITLMVMTHLARVIIINPETGDIEEQATTPEVIEPQADNRGLFTPQAKE